VPDLERLPLDVVVENLCRQEERLAREDRHAETVGEADLLLPLRERKDPVRRLAGDFEDLAVERLVHVQVGVTHELLRRRRLSVRADHDGLEAGHPEQLGRARLLDPDHLRALRPEHRLVLAIDEVGLRDELRLLRGRRPGRGRRGAGGRLQCGAEDREKDRGRGYQ
jgi:hypothetical protein